MFSCSPLPYVIDPTPPPYSLSLLQPRDMWHCGEVKAIARIRVWFRLFLQWSTAVSPRIRLLPFSPVVLAPTTLLLIAEERD